MIDQEQLDLMRMDDDGSPPVQNDEEDYLFEMITVGDMYQRIYV